MLVQTCCGELRWVVSYQEIGPSQLLSVPFAKSTRKDPNHFILLLEKLPTLQMLRLDWIPIWVKHQTPYFGFLEMRWLLVWRELFMNGKGQAHTLVIIGSVWRLYKMFKLVAYILSVSRTRMFMMHIGITFSVIFSYTFACFAYQKIYFGCYDVCACKDLIIFVMALEAGAVFRLSLNK